MSGMKRADYVSLIALKHHSIRISYIQPSSKPQYSVKGSGLVTLYRATAIFSRATFTRISLASGYYASPYPLSCIVRAG